MYFCSSDEFSETIERVYKITMTLQLGAAPPEAYIWGGGVRGGGFRAPEMHNYARLYIRVGAVSGQFVVPLERRPPSQKRAPGPGSRPWRQNLNLVEIRIFRKLRILLGNS